MIAALVDGIAVGAIVAWPLWWLVSGMWWVAKTIRKELK